MRRKKELFSLIVAGLLFISVGPAFATSLVKVARDTLDTQLKATVPGYNKSSYGYDESSRQDVIFVYVETKEDKAKIPDSHMGYPIEKIAKSEIVKIRDAFHEEFKTVPGYNESSYGYDEWRRQGVIFVYVETKEDKAKIPDSYMGYRVEKRVEPKIAKAYVAMHEEFHGKVAGFYATHSNDAIIVYIRNEEDKAKIPDSYMGYPVQVRLRRGERWVIPNFWDDYGHLQGIVAVDGPSEETKGAIVVYINVKSKLAKAKIPDSYEGYPIQKEVVDWDMRLVSSTTSIPSKPKYHWTDKPLMKPGGDSVTVIPPPVSRMSISFGRRLSDFFPANNMTGGALGNLMDVEGLDRDNKTVVIGTEFSMQEEFSIHPESYYIGISRNMSRKIKSRIDELSMPGTFTIHPGGSYIGMSNNDSQIGKQLAPQSSLPNLGTKPQLVPQFSLPQPSVAPTNLGTKLQMDTNANRVGGF